MSQTYKIHRWDAVLFGNSTDPTPIIYIKPDKELLAFAKDNKDALLINIQNTGSIYNNKKIVALWKKSSEIPNCRPNFFEKTGLYVLILQAPWHGYPDFNGECKIYGVHGGVPAKSLPYTKLTQPSKQANSTIGNTTDNNQQHDKLSIGSMLGIFAAICLIIFIYIFLMF